MAHRNSQSAAPLLKKGFGWFSSSSGRSLGNWLIKSVNAGNRSSVRILKSLPFTNPSVSSRSSAPEIKKSWNPSPRISLINSPRKAFSDVSARAIAAGLATLPANNNEARLRVVPGDSMTRPSQKSPPSSTPTAVPPSKSTKYCSNA